MVERLVGSCPVSERRACRVLCVPRATYRYRSCLDPRTELRMRIREIAQTILEPTNVTKTVVCVDDLLPCSARLCRGHRTTSRSSRRATSGCSPLHCCSIKDQFYEWDQRRRAKIFDDSMLQQQLEVAQVKLAALQGFDQTSLTSHLGNVSGNTQDFHSFSLNVLGPSVSGLSTTTSQPNIQVVNTGDLQTTSPAAGSTTPSTVQDDKLVSTINPQTVQPIKTVNQTARRGNASRSSYGRYIRILGSVGSCFERATGAPVAA
jgi:hypothetical protein